MKFDHTFLLSVYKWFNFGGDSEGILDCGSL